MPSAEKQREMERFAALDNRLVNAAKGIKVLTNLSWPQTVCAEFLAGWDGGRPKIPEVGFIPVHYKDNIVELNRIMKECERTHPIGNYIYLTAESYALAARMLEERGKATFTELSSDLYGRPTDSIGSGKITHLDAANHFMETTRDFIAAYKIPPGEYCLGSEQVAQMLKQRLVPFFKDHPVDVVIDPGLPSKAAASSRRIRLRGATSFSSMDVAQLYNHEGLVHMLTMLNGREQPVLKSMGLGSPRTTRTQEGLATFAELITSSIDIHRLQRIALRIRAVSIALEGGDFVEVFRFFLEAGQDPQESFHSAARVFRGGDPRGRVCFTKDVVYLQGLIFIHTFLRKAIQGNKFNYPAYLFSGRVTLGDVIALEPFLDSGFIAPPLYQPPWLANRQCLAAYLCYSIFANKISLGEITLNDFLIRDR